MERETKDEWNLFTFNTHFISSQQSFPLSFLLIFLWLIPEGSSFPFLHTIPSNLFLGVIFKGMWWIVYPFLTLQNMPIIELNETEINHENPFLCCRTPEFRWKKTGGGWREKCICNKMNAVPFIFLHSVLSLWLVKETKKDEAVSERRPKNLS